VKRNIVRTTLLITFSATFLVGLAPIGRAQEESAAKVYYTVTNLGTLGGTLGSSADSVNDRGWVAGVANVTGDTAEHAALWLNGAVTDLGTLGGSNSNVDLPVKNDAGFIAGFAQTSTVDPLGETFCTFSCSPTGAPCQGTDHSCRGFVWKNGQMMPLGTLGGNNSAATGMNNRGLVVGLAENGTHDANCTPPQVLDYEAAIWDAREGTIHSLPALPGDVTGAAIGVNDNDQVVGGSGMCGGGPGIYPVFLHAVLWQEGTVTDLGSLGGVLNNAANAINNQGQVAGASDLTGDNTGHAFVWQNSVMTDLGTLPGDFSSAALSINDAGQVVGQSCDVNSNCRAFLWQNGVMTDLNTLTTPASSLYLVEANDINSQGEIVGLGVDRNGEPLAFQAVPAGGTSTEQSNGNSVPRVTLPENVRKLLQRRMRPVTFTPEGTGTFNGTLSITDNAPGSPQTVSLSGTRAVTPVKLKPVRLSWYCDYGTTCNVYAQTITLTNKGPGAISIGISITGSSLFSQTNNCGTSVGAGGSCGISVYFRSSGVGNYSGDVVVTYNGVGSPQQVSLDASVVCCK
jgi:probable HAF family extracellular repeat protein